MPDPESGAPRCCRHGASRPATRRGAVLVDGEIVRRLAAAAAQGAGAAVRRSWAQGSRVDRSRSAQHADRRGNRNRRSRGRHNSAMDAVVVGPG